MEATGFSETLVNTNKPHDVTARREQAERKKTSIVLAF
jgi:hypothetical protein